MSEHRVLVCGGRDFTDRREVERCLSGLAPRPTMIIHGGARGADKLAWWWAERAGVSHWVFHAAWDVHHPDARIRTRRDGSQYDANAGPRRNQKMLDEGKPHLVVAFPGGTGTADMVRRAKAAGVRVIEVGK